ncbi:hypothetical protein BT96DRAFT_263771 [Gymnopus androsaceus JB14]|uniref:Uncharacterized protein n=1 Tax=Gymnopus androsaceus JB14 TaxID=1447944 RepID=A0A6A4H4X4_9AGAR|nr:hypothetical protein BT96DRAFT_263771 [Gymnopus androsaceus JB14]
MILPRRESNSAPDTSCHGIMSSGSSSGSKNWVERFNFPLTESGQSTSQRRSCQFDNALDPSKHGNPSTHTTVTTTATATATSTLGVESTSVSGSSTFGRVTSNSPNNHTDAIIGVVFGALATFGIIVLISVYYLRKSKKNRLATAIRVLPRRPSAGSAQLALTQKESSMGGEVEAYILEHVSESPDKYRRLGAC